MAIVKGILQMKIEDTLKDVWTQTGSDQVIVDTNTGKTLATALSEILADLQSAVAGGVTITQVDEHIDAAIDALIDGAPTTRDTFKEINDYINEHEDTVELLNSAIGNKVDKVSGKGLSTNDFTTALMNKLNNIAEGATKVEVSSTNGNIKINGSEKSIYTHPTGAGYNHIPTGGSVGQVLRAKGNGDVEYGVAVRSGASVPSDLAEGEMFLKIVE